ncbi:MAG: sigma-70 family RNA polymerase sigma factor [Gemmatimonadetes bacterium]|nr:sigma-70 family RNA polymerase sigma factor [Gemmatimonadota bacterium]MCH7715537.1 sigma-70 family RNA polymerase sigma factor [Gemmatimonadota bacterium]
MDEPELISRVRRGDAVAERELYEAHVDRVYRLAYRMAGDDVLAQDITQDTFIRAFDRIHDFRGDSAFGTWLHAVGNSVALNTLRKVKRFRSREADLDEARAVGDATLEAEPDLRARLRAAIDDLPHKYRVVFIMHDVEGYKHHEIAESLGMPVGTSKAQLSRARARLRESLAEFAQEWVS